MKKIHFLLGMIITILPALMMAGCPAPDPGDGGDDGGGENSTYTVSYDGNEHTGGSVPVDSNRYEEEQTYTVLGNTGNLMKPGYALTVWNTQADCCGTDCTIGEICTMGAADVTLYANWKRDVAYQKISDTAGGFTGVLDNSNYFGFSAASLGDLDGDGVEDLAVGARFDDDRGTPPDADRGAVWVLFMDTDGTLSLP